MTGLAWWSQTAANNATQDPTIGWAEGMAPSAVNDSARAMMASTAKWRDDIAGAITTGGTSTAFTMTSYQTFDSLSRLANQLIGFVPHATNTNTAGADITLNVDSLGAKPVRLQPSVALPGGSLILGTPYVVVYNNSDGVFYLHNMTNPYAVPLGGMIDYIGSSTPNSAFVFPIGQAISRTTYATLFSLVGTTYGTGDGSTTFNVPDMTGRVSAMKEASATRLTSSFFGGNSTSLGAVGFNEKNALSSTNQIPQFTPTTASTSFSGGNAVVPIQGTTTPGSPVGAALQGNNTSGGTTLNASVTGTVGVTMNSIGSASPSSFATGQPTMILNKILRVL